MCIYEHVHKVKEPKCPTCEEKIEKNFNKSIKKDPFKQSLVDILYPEFQAKDSIIIKRVREVFPNLNLQTITNAYTYQTTMNYEVRKRRKAESKRESKINFGEIVSKTLNVSLDQFLNDIMDENRFEELKKKRKIETEASKVEPLVQDPKIEKIYRFCLYPKSEEDQQLSSLLCC
eukprot:TRINITY_DN31898_c0_g1_i2.p2 TRINITY_DN31898_c0_g1~~TRINITY_DN31898_c0_g1_i2.p2  ORF type:complete len:175 (-),score=30.04 TRINITY_DN31898_c0_g1_i2:200-724(-)